MKAPIRLRGCAVWSGLSLSAYVRICFLIAHNVRVHIILYMRKVSTGHLLSNETFYSSQWFCLRTVKALIRLCGCAGWSGPSQSAYARTHVFSCRRPYLNRKWYGICLAFLNECLVWCFDLWIWCNLSYVRMGPIRATVVHRWTVITLNFEHLISLPDLS